MKGCAMKNLTQEDILRLSVAERLQLVYDIWDTIPQSSEEPILTAEQKEKLDMRLEAPALNPHRGTPWSTVRTRIIQNS